MAKPKPSAEPKKPGNIDAFIALSDAEKEAVYRSVDREIPLSETRPLTKAERARWDRARRADVPRKALRAAVTRTVSVSLDEKLLVQADRYAKAHGLKRTDLFAAGLRLAMAAGAGAGAGEAK